VRKARLNWSRPLPQPLLIPDVMVLATLADVRELMRHLPANRRERSTWRRVAVEWGGCRALPSRVISSLKKPSFFRALDDVRILSYIMDSRSN